MSDLVEHLRRQASQQDMLTCEDMLQAADEIERLRAELALYKQNYARKQLTDSERRELEGK